jgi:hypothetical protein
MPPKLPNSMPWQIYQAYLSGPYALFKLFEEAFGRYALYGPPDLDQQQRTIDALSEQVGQLKTQNERLQAEVSDLRGQVVLQKIFWLQLVVVKSKRLTQYLV